MSDTPTDPNLILTLDISGKDPAATVAAHAYADAIEATDFDRAAGIRARLKTVYDAEQVALEAISAAPAT